MAEISETYLTIVNPAAGSGGCGRRAPRAIERLRAAGLTIEVRETRAAGDGTRIAREAHGQGYRRFVAVGGDGTSFEVLNGLAPAGLGEGAGVTLGFLPLGTGNSFLRDFSSDIESYALESLITRRRRQCDVLRLDHRDGREHFINLCGFGFACDASRNSGRHYKRLGAAGYILGVFHTLARLRHPQLPVRVDGGPHEERPVTMLTISNSRYTATMLIAPDAEIDDGRADLVRVDPLGRLRLLAAFPSIFSGAHVEKPFVTTKPVRRVEFECDRPHWAMIDGEVMEIVPHCVEVLPGALEICA